MAEKLNSDKIVGAARGLGAWIRAHAGLVAFCALVGVFYLWTIRSSRDPGVAASPPYYGLMADAFLHGHLHLLWEPSSKLLALPNPYDPSQNVHFALHDLSLYHGHYYPYWGPAPAVVLYAPLHIVGIDMSDTTAIFLFSFVGFCFSVAVLRELAARFAPRAPRWMLGASVVVLALGNVLPFTLRRPEVYEVAISAAFCFCFIALWLTVSALRTDRVSRRRLGLAALFVGLAVASRATMVFPALALVGLAFWLSRRESVKADGARILAVVIAPIAAIAVLLMAYNVARFGSPLEMGQSYQLAGFEVSKRDPNQVSYVPPGLWYYLVSTPDLTWRFPFLQLSPTGGSYPLSAPRAYTGVEQVTGIFVSIPFTLFAFAGLFVTRGRLRSLVATFCAISVAIMLFTSFALWGATERYEVDFATFLLIAGALTWMVWSQKLGPRARTALLWVGGTFVVWSAVFGVLFSLTGYHDRLRDGSPGTYDRLERLTAIVPTIGSKIEGKPLLLGVRTSFGPIIDDDPSNNVGRVGLEVAPDVTADLTVASGSNRTYGLVVSGSPTKKDPPTSGILIRVPQTGDVHVIKGRRIPRTVVPIKLKRGLNHILISGPGPVGSLTWLTGVGLAPPTPIVSDSND
jgi:hypothetical protein